MLALIGVLAREIPCYTMEFDRSGGIIAELQDLMQRPVSSDKATR